MKNIKMIYFFHKLYKMIITIRIWNLLCWLTSFLLYSLVHFFTFDSVIERSVAKFVDERKVQLLKDKGLPVEGCVIVAGRTDKGVTALQQVCAFCMLLTHLP